MENSSSYELKVWNKHILISEIEGLLLIDTGSPKSFHKKGKIEIAGHTYSVPTTLMGIDTNYLKEKVGCEVAGLIGMDILNDFSVWFNTPKFGNFIGFFDLNDFSDFANQGFPVADFMGCPCIVLSVKGKRGRFIFDTGAHIPYISEKFIDNDTTYCGVTTDFSPMLNQESFDLKLFYLESELKGFNGDGRFNAMYAQMPKKLETILSPFGIDGIIGFDLINQFRLIVREGKVYFPPQGI